MAAQFSPSSGSARARRAVPIMTGRFTTIIMFVQTVLAPRCSLFRWWINPRTVDDAVYQPQYNFTKCWNFPFDETSWDRAEPVRLGDFVDTDDEEWDYWEAREVVVWCKKGSIMREQGNTMNFELTGHKKGTVCDGNIFLFVGGGKEERDYTPLTTTRAVSAELRQVQLLLLAHSAEESLHKRYPTHYRHTASGEQNQAQHQYSQDYSHH